MLYSCIAISMLKINLLFFLKATFHNFASDYSERNGCILESR